MGGYIGNSGTPSYGIVLYGSNDFLDADIHGESAQYLTDMFFVTAPRGTSSLVLNGLKVRDHSSYANNSIFKLDPALSKGVALTNLDIEVGGLVATRVFEDPARWTVSGIYRLPIKFSAWNLPASQFSGVAIVGLAASFFGTTSISMTGRAPPSESCTPGELRSDSDFIYVCVSTGKWKRAALSTW